jgi:hypothetical protein
MPTTTNFASIDGQCFQKPNPGGLRRVLCVLVSKVEGNWPVEADVTAARITTLPTLATGEKWAEYVFPDGTANFDSDFTGDPGYESWKHMMEISLAGHSDATRQEVAKHLNAGSLWLMEDKDGEYNVLGSTDDPIFVKGGFKGGKKGNDKRGYTLKGEVDGMSWDVLPVTKTLISTIVVATQV